MAREELWRVLNEAAEALDESFDALEESFNTSTALQIPYARAAVEAAVSRYCDCLGPILGHGAAFTYQASWQASLDAIERHERLRATLAAKPTTDVADAAMLRQLKGELDAAARNHLQADAAMRAALDETQARDRAEGAVWQLRPGGREKGGAR